MRPPSPCHGKIALPHVLASVSDDEIAVSMLPRLPFVNGTSDAVGFARALASSRRHRSRRAATPYPSCRLAHQYHITPHHTLTHITSHPCPHYSPSQPHETTPPPPPRARLILSRLLLLDPSNLREYDDLSGLLVTPKGWLCTLEHKSCQHTC